MTFYTVINRFVLYYSLAYLLWLMALKTVHTARLVLWLLTDTVFVALYALSDNTVLFSAVAFKREVAFVTVALTSEEIGGGEK
ncbi:MAG: hypothetical protein PHE67_00350 [Campylobacterales bacterium]|nr:hypothetical protein [Campylobacterales bacterium]